MKKQNLLFKISVTLIMIFLFYGVTFSQEVARRITYEAQYTTVKPVIDGFVDPVWEDANEGKMDQIVEGGPTTVDGSFKVLWDEEFLYFFIQVNDPIRSAWNFESENVDPWMYDNVEIFMGPANHPEAEYKTGDRQYRFTPGIDGLYNPWDDPRTINEDVEFAEQDNTSNYVFEIAWPWTHIVRDTLELLPKMTTGKVLEFEIQFADNNTPGEAVRDNVVAWNNDTDDGNSWNNTHLWGFMELIGTVNVSNIKQQEYLKIYPSPALDFIKIESQNSFSQVYVTNIIGQSILQKTFTSGEFNYTLDLSKIENGGVYILNIITEKGRESRRFIIIK